MKSIASSDWMKLLHVLNDAIKINEDYEIFTLKRYLFYYVGLRGRKPTSNEFKSPVFPVWKLAIWLKLSTSPCLFTVTLSLPCWTAIEPLKIFIWRQKILKLLNNDLQFGHVISNWPPKWPNIKFLIFLECHPSPIRIMISNCRGWKKPTATV